MSRIKRDGEGKPCKQMGWKGVPDVSKRFEKRMGEGKILSEKIGLSRFAQGQKRKCQRQCPAPAPTSHLRRSQQGRVHRAVGPYSVGRMRTVLSLL